MLYIDVQVNGHPVKAFVDSGAQSTIMSPSCAETCGIMRLIDTRFAGEARGVGVAKILGRVHTADIKIGNAVFPSSFTVMEGKDVDLLLGLDMLKRYQANIDLKRNKLVFGDNEVDFLPEADIPQHFSDAQDSEEVIPGPDGTEIGAESGTVKPAGSSAAASGSYNLGGTGRALGRNLPEPNIQPTPATGQSSSQAARRPAPVPAPARAQRTHPTAAINQLQSLGFSRAQAIAALDATDGNVEYAAGLLFQR